MARRIPPSSHARATARHRTGPPKATNQRTAGRTVILLSVIVAVEQTTWDLISQIGVWFVGLPLLVGVLLVYTAYQVTLERRANQRTAGRWGLAAKNSRDTDA